MRLFGYNITTNYPQFPVQNRTIVNTINPHSYCVSKKDKLFENALMASDVLLPDGIGIVWAAKMLNGQKIQKIAGFDLFVYALHHLESTKSSCFFLGASEETLNAIIKRVSSEFPSIKVKAYSPPYKPHFSEEDSIKMCRTINSFMPEIVFVGMTAPKQEKWIHKHKDQLNAKVICSIGAVFDFYAGTVKRPSQFWINLGLEWLPRFIKEPKRLAQRNLVSTPKFILEVFYFKMFGKGFM